MWAEYTPDFLGNECFQARRSGYGGGAGSAETAKAGEEFAGTGDVVGDLQAKLFGAGEFFFGAKAAPELDFNARGRNVAFEVEEMCFDGLRGAVEGGASADVGDRAARLRFAFEHGAGDVDAALGQ